MQKNFLRKMWWDGRMGHSSYLMLVLQLVNFLLIVYNFLIEGNKVFEVFITDLWLFSTIIIIFYIPISILIGNWHRHTQISTEKTITMMESPMIAKMFKGLLNVQDGISNEEDIKEFREFLKEIEKKDIKEF